MFLDFEGVLGDFNLIQQVRFATWSRIIGDELKESTLDHIYCIDPTRISSISSILPYFGDHRLIMFSINVSKSALLDLIYIKSLRHDKYILFAARVTKEKLASIVS